MENGKDKGLESGEDVVPASQLRQAEARIRELERILGKKTVQVEILEEAVRIAREKKTNIARQIAEKGTWPLKTVADTMGVSRSQLYAKRVRRGPQVRPGVFISRYVGRRNRT
jgi:transposase